MGEWSAGAAERTAVYEDAGLREIDEGSIRPGGAALTLRALALSGLPPGSRVLDVGCGMGAAVRRLTEHCGLRAFGVDPSEALLRDGRGRFGRLPVARGAGESLPFGDGVMDGEIAECSLSVAEDAERVLAECFRVLKPGGRLLASDVYARKPDGAREAATLPFECCLAGAVSEEAWLARVRGAGFEPEVWEDHSRALKEFAARLVFAYGSLEAFWSRFGRAAESPEIVREVQCAVAAARPGYFLMVARKP